MNQNRPIDCAESMISEIKRLGIVPFTNCGIDGWSIQEMTAPGCWFDSEGVLGPWDWKIDCVQTGEIVFGKLLGGKSAFMTVEFYRELMNYRRSLPKYRMPLRERFKAVTATDKMMKILSPIVYNAIKETGSISSKEIRTIAAGILTPQMIKPLGAKYRPLLIPTIKKNILDSVIGYLQMGTWCVVGDYERIYKGPNLEYSGWQHAMFTTPDILFPDTSSKKDSSSSSPSWAKMFEDGLESDKSSIKRTPEQSRDYLISHVLEFYPDASVEKLMELF